jgi:hypothetical protein
MTQTPPSTRSNQPMFTPNFQSECRECGNSPTVVVVGHEVPETELCGWHFWLDLEKIDWLSWNDDSEEDDE